MYKVHRHIHMKHVVIDIYKQNSSVATTHELFVAGKLRRFPLSRPFPGPVCPVQPVRVGAHGFA